MKAECPECGWSKEVSDNAEGKKGRCPECGTIFQIGSPVKNTVNAESVETTTAEPAAYEEDKSRESQEGKTDKLTDCKECGREIASTAKTCPHCGVSAPGKEKNWEPCPKCGSVDVTEWGVAARTGFGVLGAGAMAGCGAMGCLPLLLLAPVFLIIGPLLPLKRCKDCGKVWTGK